jgi:ABC-type branched-subunit amino acid transport system substrate-binding protein
MTIADGVEASDDPSGYPALARRLAATHPDAIVYTGLGDANAGPLLASLARALPKARLFGSSALVAATTPPAGLPRVDVLSPLLPPRTFGPRARRVLRATGTTEVEALYGYEAMRVVLDAIAAAGADANDRATVAREALTPRTRQSVIGPYRVLPGGDRAPVRFGAYEHSSRGTRYLGER